MEDLIGLVAVLAIFIGLPWLILHYRAKGREAAGAAAGAPVAGDLVALADKLEKRLEAIETILDDEIPGWRRGMDRRHT